MFLSETRARVLGDEIIVVASERMADTLRGGYRIHQRRGSIIEFGHSSLFSIVSFKDVMCRQARCPLVTLHLGLTASYAEVAASGLDKSRYGSTVSLSHAKKSHGSGM
mgnify:CR=1 FL=1